MKRILILIAALAAITACDNRNKKPMDTPKDLLVHRLFEYSAAGQIAYGHQDDLFYGHNWVVSDPENDPLDRSDVKDVAGAYPMILGCDLGGIEMGWEENLDGVPFDLMRRAALKQIERGGIVTFSWHPRNPLTGGDAWDVSSDQVVKSVLKGGENVKEFRAWLKRAADFIESIGTDVPIIFRPWHENIGSWFWWGGKLCSEEEYKELYRMTWLYFMKERGLTNILWCYSPNGDVEPPEYMSRYPGDDFVDILGVDTYEYIGDGTVEEAGASYQGNLRRTLTFVTTIASDHKKIVCLSETGLEGLVDPTWWTETLYPVISDFAISYVLTWRNAYDKPTHFYAPWKGFEWADDFKQFTEKENIVLL